MTKVVHKCCCPNTWIAHFELVDIDASIQLLGGHVSGVVDAPVREGPSDADGPLRLAYHQRRLAAPGAFNGRVHDASQSTHAVTLQSDWHTMNKLVSGWACL